VKESVAPEFVFHLLQWKANDILQSCSKVGTTVESIQFRALKDYPVHIPTISEQRKIAEILSTWDKAIEQVDKLIEQKKKLKKGLMQQLLTGKRRFPGFDVKWEGVKLSEIASKKKGRPVEISMNRDGVPYLGSEAMSGNITAFTIDPSAILCKSEDVLVLWDGEYAGKCAFGLEGAVGSTVVALELVEERASSEYLHNKLSYDNQRIRAIREGSGVPHLPGDFLLWYRFDLPPLNEQRRISRVLTQLEEDVVALSYQRTLMETQKRGLMQLLLSGKKRVKSKKEEANESK